ncbi:histone arginine methyltransferase PRMT3 [Babesia ovata]|uniref:type I protein arginine methyltransferase n=1 Tax=Babesia ovata TaxID=189622 RepID=A0A2H6K8X8_9APIC|nr:histone arginine methyltransferase PRMT3 [Babesia ovata]GBE59440.1 histone arginine methyltransferase PRMT3 [Babesia ovata]
MSSMDSSDSCSSGSELEETWEGEGVARSLFDDFSSPFAAQVYRHMATKFGFDHRILGKGALHRVALVTYLQREKAKGADVLGCYQRIRSDPSIVLNRLEEFIRPPFDNEKLLWDFMESSDEEGDEGLLSKHLSQEVTKTEQAIKKRSTEDEEYFKCYKGLGIHREMVQDKVRTGAYEAFIRLNKSLFKDKVVLDVGCGSGILSLLAAKHGAKLVVGIDNCENLVNMSTEHARVNNLANVRFLHGKVEDSDLAFVDGTLCFKLDANSNVPHEPFKCDILISEWMGYGLLYENMLPSVLFARDKYLKEDGIMAPSKVKLGFFAIDMHDQLKEKMREWDEPKYGLVLSGLRYEAAELLKMPAVEAADPSCIVSDASGICIMDLKRVKPSELCTAHEFEVKVHEGKTCSSLVLYFDCIFEPHYTADEGIPAVLNLKSKIFGGLDSYRESLPGADRARAYSVSPDYAGSEEEGGVVVIMSTRPDQTTTHWKQVLLHLVDHNDSPVRLTDTIHGTVSLLKNPSNSRWLDILLRLRDSAALGDCYYKLM